MTFSFSFPAHHKEIINISEDLYSSIRTAKQALLYLNWEIIEETENQIISKTNPSWKSWGEKIILNFETNKIKIESKCSLSTQCFDWGKNKSNINLFKQGYELSKNKT